MNKRGEQRQKGKNLFFYLILILMLVFSFKIYYDSNHASVSAGNFGNGGIERNVSFSDLSKRFFGEVGKDK